MKLSTPQIAALMKAAAQDTMSIGFETLAVILKRSFVITNMSGEQIESKEWTIIAPTDDAGDYTGLSSLATTIEHGTAIVARSKAFVIDGIQADDPTEGFTRLILTEA